MAVELDIEEQEALRELEHDELVKAVKAIPNAIATLSKEDPELKKLLTQNKEAINNFVEAVKEFKNQEKQEVKVETNQDKVVAAISDLGKILSGIDKRLTELEKRPIPKEPKKLIVSKRNGYNGSGTINEVTIEYNK